MVVLHPENRAVGPNMTYGKILKVMMQEIPTDKASPVMLAWILLNSLVAEFDLYDKPVAHPDYVDTKLNA